MREKERQAKKWYKMRRIIFYCFKKKLIHQAKPLFKVTYSYTINLNSLKKI